MFYFVTVNMILCGKFDIVFLVLYFSFNYCNAEEECSKKTPSHEKRLKNTLLCNYDTDARPRIDSTESVNVSAVLRIMKFDYRDVGDQLSEGYLTIRAWVILNWADDYLTWTPKDYGDHEELVIDSSNIWVPDLSMYNSISTAHSGDHFYTPCVVKYTGRVTCIPHIMFEAPCDFDYRNWPLDTQNCSMTFGSWMYRGEETRITIKTITFDPNSEGAYWKILKYGKTNHNGVYDYYPNTTYPHSSVWIALKRKADDQIIFVLTSAMVTILLTVTTLLLNINSIERIILPTANLFYNLYFLNILLTMAPATGNVVPNVVLFFRNSVYLAFTVLIESLLLKSLLKRTDVAPRWVNTMTGIMNTGAGKVIMFHEFDPAGTAIVSGDAEALNKEEMEIISKQEWLKFTLFMNRIFLILIFIIYLIFFLLAI